MRQLRQMLGIILGGIAFALGILGAILPVLPTTPFLLLAGFLWARSSTRINRWLRGTRIYQFYCADFVDHRAIPKSKKRKMLFNIYLLMGISITFAPGWHLKGFLAGITLILTYLLMIKVPNRPVEDPYGDEEIRLDASNNKLCDE